MIKITKKAQINLTETVAVIFIFFVLILFASVFYFNFQQESFEKKQKEFLNSRAIDTATKVLFLPEFVCTKGDAEPESNCLDMMKVRHAAELFEKNKESYFELFSFAKIIVNQTYPEPFQMVLYEKTPLVIKNKKPTFFVVSLKDEKEGENNYGYGNLIIEVYS